MRKIYFIRHAKAEPSNNEKNDFKRVLTERGIGDIAIMAGVLAKKDIKPDKIISSDAFRCKDTAKRLLSAMKLKKRIAYDNGLYETDITYLLKFIKGVKGCFKEIILVLHEPSITQICEYMSGVVIDKVPTCGVFCLEFECGFSEIHKGCAKALFFETPKRYKISKDKLETKNKIK